jgi:uncharacterized protein YndB with AHSA1/START domain
MRNYWLHIGEEAESMVPDRIESEVLIEAPVDVVWSIVTEGEHVGKWFSDSAEIELEPGGKAVLTWDEHGSFPGRVERVEPPRFISFRWARPAGVEPTEGNSTLVEFTLSAEGEGTRLHVVESGFRELDGTDEEKAEYAEGNTLGWAKELGELREYVSEHVGAPTRR